MTVDVMAPVSNSSMLGRSHPLAKLGAAVAVTVAAMITVDMVSSSVLLACELALIPATGISIRLVLLRGWPILVAAAVSGYGTALLAPASGTVLIGLGPLEFTTGAVAAGAAIAIRGLALAMAGVLLLFTTDPTDLADGLAQNLRLPHRFVLGALAGMRLVGLMVEEWQTLSMARRARGVGTNGGFIARVTASLGQALALLVQAIRRASRLAVTMEARGFGAGPRTWARESRFRVGDAAVLASGVAMASLATGAAIAAGVWNPIL